MYDHTGLRIPAGSFAALGLICVTMQAQQPRQYTDQDYAAAEKFMFYNLGPLAWKGVVNATWLPDGRIKYRAVDGTGFTYAIVDPVKRAGAPMFDQDKVADLLKEASKGAIKTDGRHVLVNDISLSDEDHVVTFTAGETVYRCDLAAKPESCKAISAASGWPLDSGHETRPPMTLSPDKKLGAFISDWNLWVRDLASGSETQLTTDGMKDYGYATDNAGWKSTDAAILLWSPDSKKIATFQQDQRRTGEMYLVPVTNRHPQLKVWKYPLVGDKDVTMIERVILDVNARKVIRLKMPPDQHRSTICDDVACDGTDFSDVEWSADGSHLAFVSTSRDHKQEWLRVADAATGEVHDIMTETAATFLDSGNGKVNWHYLPASNEILWFSARDDWGNVYLYDLATGKLKNQITRGPGNVTQVLRVDPTARMIYFLGMGREAGRDPYFRHFYSVHFDGSGLRLLTPEDADHDVRLSPDGRYFVDSWSTPVQPGVTVVRDAEGKTVMELGRQDISPLVQAGWKPPVPIKVKARDGKTDLYGLMFKPTRLDPAAKYPIVDFVYPGPQGSSCPERSFHAGFLDLPALAELGFVVVCIDAMGTESRSKSFHEAYYGNMGDNGIPDQVAGIRQLAAQYPFIDLDRVGIYGHSGGGFAAAAAMFHYPDFFKVGISESGNHDNRDYEDDWAEKWSGLEEKKPNGTSNYDSQANQNFAQNLKGHLLLSHGTMDDNVPPNNTLMLVNALIKANKDFDLLLIPNVAHGYGPTFPYMARRRWDYFVRYLKGDTPPHEYQMKSFDEIIQVMKSGPGLDDSSDSPLGNP
ncbi:MAG TPA: DPP IV N-terminal domain-containing protein [Terracidiphilus sp.]